MVGPPGSGKILLAKAVAGEAGVPFFSISGSDFVEIFVGVGAIFIVIYLIKQKKKLHNIIFIDEIDAAFKINYPGGIGGNDEREIH